MTAGLNPAFATRLGMEVGPPESGAADEVGVRDTILVVDDETEITASVAELLGRDHRVLTASSADEALRLLGENEVSLILTDQRMPNATGAELLARSLALAPEATRVLFTGYSDLHAVIEAVNDGKVYYYLTKPWRPDELRAVVRQGLERFHLFRRNRELLEELRRANEELEDRVRRRTAALAERNRDLQEAKERIEDLVRTDPLTDLANRRRLSEVVVAEMGRCRRYGSALSVVMVDLDHFKEINDDHGHVAGDETLRRVARVLREAARATDLVGRYGGEEFLLVLPNTGLPEAAASAERFRRALAESTLPFRPSPVTGSFGVATWREGDSEEMLVGRADAALYEAKRAGRNRVEVER